MATLAVPLTDFGERHFGQATLGDERRRKRLVILANQVAAHPEGSLPHKLGNPAAYQAMFRLCKCPEVTHAAVLETHCQATLARMRECLETVLVLHDTTELDFTSRNSLRKELGQIGDGGGRGYECHNSLAVTARSGELLGLVNQILHHRAKVPKNEGLAAKRAREDRESLLWLRGSAAVGAPPPEARWVDVCDRGADTFEFLDDEDRRDRQYVVRSNYNRSILLGHAAPSAEEQPGCLHDYLRTVAPIGGRLVHVPARDGQPARIAKCLVAVAPVRILPPHNRRGEHRGQPLCVWTIRVWEIDSPEGVKEPLEWILLTNVPTTNLDETIERVRWYERRWTIEDFHKGQKTGCGIERLQFQSVDRLEPMIALLSVVAVMLVNLRYAARREDAVRTPAIQYVSHAQVAVLSVWRYKERRLDLTVHEFFYALARLGGHQNRKSDGPPGWITLWRGWNQLQQMVDYATKAGVEKCDEY